MDTITWLISTFIPVAIYKIDIKIKYKLPCFTNLRGALRTCALPIVLADLPLL